MLDTAHEDPAARAREELPARLKPLREQAAQGGGGVALAQAFAAEYDRVILPGFSGAARGDALTLLAVGGYGRAMLSPSSDLDLLILTEGDPAAARGPTEAFLYPLWDARLTIGHAVRRPDDLVSLARQDLPTATTLLDARFLAGDAGLARETLARGWRSLFDGDLGVFLDALADEMSGRHQRFGATVYLLEPDVKHSRGALRDLDIVRWALRARYRTEGFGSALRLGAISGAEHAALCEAQEFMLRLRAVLHGRHGRRSDRLTFDEQEEAAVRLGYCPDDALREDPLRARAEGSERLMSAYYRHARAVTTLLDPVLERCRPGRITLEPVARVERVGEDIHRFDGCVHLTSPEALRRDVSLALRVVEAAVTLGEPLAQSTREGITAAARDPAWCAALRAHRLAPMAFLRLLTHSGRAVLRPRNRSGPSGTGIDPGSVLAELHDLGLLLAMIPEFAHVTGRVQHDIYHVYTVDVHSVAAVDRLHAFARADREGEFPLPTRMMAGVDRKDLLCLATLLHDIGKSRGGPHSRIGAEMSVEVCERLGLCPDDVRSVATLVLEHLTLYHAATRRDLSDPAVIASVAETVGDDWHLRALYLLTVADLSTTSPTAMTSWKARMLDSLYEKVSDGLSQRPGRSGRSRDDLVRQALAHAAADTRGHVERFLSRMPDRYVLATPPEAIERHARALADASPTGTVVHLSALASDPTGELTEILIAAPDRPGLLATLAAMLYAQRLDVLSAEIYSSESRALDVFVVRRATSDAASLARLTVQLPAVLADLLAGRTDPDHLVRVTRGAPRRPRPEPAVRTSVIVDQLASEQCTVFEVFSRDRPGFLYAVAREHHRLGLSIAVAKVNTEGHRATDVFYVTDPNGAKLTDDRAEAARAALLAAIEG